MDRKERFQAIVSSKDTWMWAVGAAIVITVLGATMTPKMANALWVIAVAAFAAAVFFNHKLADDHILLRLAATAAVLAGGGVVVYFFFWTPNEPPKLEIEYAVIGSETRVQQGGTKNEYKSMALKMEFFNRSSKSMTLEFTAIAQLKKLDGTYHTARMQIHWFEGVSSSLIDPSGGGRYAFVGRHSPVEGTLFIRFHKFYFKDPLMPLRWENLPLEKMQLEIRDRITGLTFVGPMRGYPPKEEPFIAITMPEDYSHFEEPQELDLVYRANLMPVAPTPLAQPTEYVSHEVPIVCDIVNRSSRNMSLRFTLIADVVLNNKMRIAYPMPGRFQFNKDDPSKKDVLNVPREKTITNGLWRFNLPHPKKDDFDFDFDSWDDVGLTRMKLKIEDEVTGIIVYTDDLMNYPARGNDLNAAFEDWRKIRKEQGDAAGATPMIGSADDLLDTLMHGPKSDQPSASE